MPRSLLSMNLAPITLDPTDSCLSLSAKGCIGGPIGSQVAEDDVSRVTKSPRHVFKRVSVETWLPNHVADSFYDNLDWTGSPVHASIDYARLGLNRFVEML